MARGYYLSPVVTTGGAQRVKVHDLLRARAAEEVPPSVFNYSYVCEIPTNPDGSAASSWGLVFVDADSLTVLDADPDLHAIPLDNLDATFGTFSAQVRTRILNTLAARGVDTSGITTSTTLRVLINRIGQHLSAGTFEAGRFRAERFLR